MNKLIIVLLILLSFTSCFNSTELTGIWKLELQIQEKAIPFKLEFKEENQVVLHNGVEAIELKYKEDTKTKQITIDVLNFDASLVLRKQDNILKGFWVKYNRTPEYKVSIFGMKLITPKKVDYTEIDKLPTKWKITLEGEQPEEAILLFSKKETKTYASILTQTGDYRYLTPKLKDKKLILTGFDGSFAFYIEGNLTNSSYSGDLFSGMSWKQAFKATPNESFELPNPEAITSFTGDIKKLKFEALDSNKKSVLKFQKDHITILQIFGSWCPNCIDETRFIQKWRKLNPNKNVDFNLISFERSPDKFHALRQIQKAIVQYEIDYPVYIGGYTKDDKIQTVLPGLENFISFPTTIFIDKKGKVRKVHAGFSGPATGKYYDRFVEEFNLFVDKLLAE